MNCDFSMQPRHSSAAFTPAKRRGVPRRSEHVHAAPALLGYVSAACTQHLAPATPCGSASLGKYLIRVISQHAHLAPAAPCGFASSSTTRSPRDGTPPCHLPRAHPRPRPPDEAGHQVHQVTKPVTKQATKQAIKPFNQARQSSPSIKPGNQALQSSQASSPSIKRTMCSLSHLSASSAADEPEPADVTACR